MSRLIGALLCACLLACGLGQAARAASLCVYEGNGSDGRGRMAAAAATLKRAPDCATDFIAFDSWTSFDNDAGWGIGGWKGSGYRLAESVPLTVKGTSLEDVAAGKQDAHFARVAQLLVANGFPDAWVRVGWEFNGGWYPWAFKGHEAAYAAAFRHVVGVMRAAAGQHFRFVWCPAQGMQQQWPDWTWPGDDVVDVIGLDVYNQSWAVNVADKAALWKDVYGSSWGVAQIVSFAAKHGKPYAFPEWGTGDRPDGHGGGDDANFIQQMSPLVAKAEFAGYWDFNAGDYNAKVSAGQRPKAAAALAVAFGAQPAAAQTTPAATLTAKIDHGGSVTVTSNADGSATLTLGFPLSTVPVTYTITLSAPRKLGFGNGKGGLSGGLWNGGKPFASFTWGVSASTTPKPQVYVGVR